MDRNLKRYLSSLILVLIVACALFISYKNLGIHRDCIVKEDYLNFLFLHILVIVAPIFLIRHFFEFSWLKACGLSILNFLLYAIITAFVSVYIINLLISYTPCFGAPPRLLSEFLSLLLMYFLFLFESHKFNKSGNNIFVANCLTMVYAICLLLFESLCMLGIS